MFKKRHPDNLTSLRCGLGLIGKFTQTVSFANVKHNKPSDFSEVFIQNYKTNKFHGYKIKICQDFSK